MSRNPAIFFQATAGYLRRTFAGIFLATSPIIAKLEMSTRFNKMVDQLFYASYRIHGLFPSYRNHRIWDTNGALVFGSASLIVRMTSALFGAKFNSNSTSNSGDSRSDDKGPEPEVLAVGQVGSRIYAFVGLERMGGFFIFDITNPTAPEFVEQVINRDLSASFAIDDSGAGAHSGSYASSGDLAPEGMKFVSAASSPTGKALLLIGNETSGTLSVYQINQRN